MEVLSLTCAPGNPAPKPEELSPVERLEQDVRETVRKMTLATLCQCRATWRPGVGPFSDSVLEQVTARLAASGMLEDDESDVGDRWDGQG